MALADDLHDFADKHLGPPEKHLSHQDAGLLHDAADALATGSPLRDHDLPDGVNRIATKLFIPDQRRIRTHDYAMLLRARNELRDLVQYEDVPE